MSNFLACDYKTVWGLTDCSGEVCGYFSTEKVGFNLRFHGFFTACEFHRQKNARKLSTEEALIEVAARALTEKEVTALDRDLERPFPE